MRRLVWFSCGAASAVAARLTLAKYENVQVVYCDTMSTEHPDNARFFRDVQEWLRVPSRVIKSSEYSSVDDVFERTRYMAGVAGARCTTEMKKVPRLAFQKYDDVHVFGYTSEESKRADDFERMNPALDVEWILIDQKVSKKDCLLELDLAGIQLPEMYRLGFDHNNCIACPKSQSPGYWNKTRQHFPDAFARRARQCELLGVRLVRLGIKEGEAVSGPAPVPIIKKGRLTGYRVFLSQVPEDADTPDDDIDCGPACQIPVDLSDLLGSE